LVCLEALTAGQAELLRQSVARRLERGEGGDGDDEPETEDESFVVEDKTGEDIHGISLEDSYVVRRTMYDTRTMYDKSRVRQTRSR